MAGFFSERIILSTTQSQCARVWRKKFLMMNMKAIACLLAFVLLSGCAAVYKSPGDILRKQHTEPKLLASCVVLADGETLYAVNTIDESHKPIIIGIHGLGGHADEFYYFTKYARRNGISFLAFDLRGFGHWKENRGDLESLKIWLADIKDIVLAIRKKYPNRKIFLLGVSLGASIVYWYCSEYKDIPAAMPEGIISLSILTRPTNRINFRNIIEGTIGYLFYPKKSMSIGSGSGENAVGKDTLKLTKVSFRLLLQSKHIIDRTPEYISQIRIPILAFQGGKDDYSTQDDIEEIVAGMRYKKFIFIAKCKHSMVSGNCKDDVFVYIKNWTNEFKKTLNKEIN